MVWLKTLTADSRGIAEKRRRPRNRDRVKKGLYHRLDQANQIAMSSVKMNSVAKILYVILQFVVFRRSKS